MAKKQSSTKRFIGSKVSRGTNNSALTPSGGQTQEASLETIISSSTDSIISQLKENEKTNESILTALDKMKSFDTSSILKSMQESLEDKMVAMLGVMYGFRGANASMKSTQFLSMLSKIDPQITANRGIYMTVKSIEDMISKMTVPSNNKKLESIAKAISDQLTEIKSKIQLAKAKADDADITLSMPDGLFERLDTLKESIISNNSANNILRVSSEINELRSTVSEIKVADYSEHIKNIADNVQKLNDKVSLIKPSGQTDLSNIIAQIHQVNESISAIKLNVPAPASVTVPEVDLSGVMSQLQSIEESVKAIKVPEFDASSITEKIDALKDSVISGVSTDDFISTTNEIIQALNAVSTESIEHEIGAITASIGSVEQLLRDEVTRTVSPASVTVPEVDLSGVMSQLQSIEESIKAINIPEAELPNINEITSDIKNIANAIQMTPLYSDETLRAQLATDFANIKNSIDGLKEFVGKSTINSSISNKSTGQEWRIAIDASGLDSDALGKLVDIFKMQIDGDLDVSQLISNIEKFQEISTIPAVDYHSVESIASMNEVLQGINTDNFNTIIDSLNCFNIENLSKQLTSLNNIDEESFENLHTLLRNYSDVIDIADSISKDTKGNTRNIDLTSVTNLANQVQTLVDNVKAITVTNEDIKNSQGVGKLIESVLGMGGFDSNRYGDLTANLRKMIYLTEKPYKFLTAVGISDRGLLWMLIHNVAEASKAGNMEEKSVQGIGEFIEAVLDIEKKLDRKQLKEFSNKLLALNVVMGEDGIKTTLKLIHEVADEYKDGNEKGIKNIKKLLKAINGLNDAVDLTSIAGLMMRLAFMDVAFLMMPLTWKLLRKATDDIDNLTQQVQKIHTILKQFDDLDTDKMKAIDAFAKGIGLMNISLSVAAATSPLAYVGLVAVLGEMSLISKIVGKINDIDASKETHQKMKDVAILITACAGVMTIAALAGAYITMNWPDILGFTASLGIFILLTIGALNIATRGMEDAKDNAEEFAKLIVICGAIMFIGGTIMTKYPQLIIGSMLFAVALGTFIFLVVNAFKFATRGEFSDIHDKLEDMFIVVGASAALMLFGAAIFEIPGMAANALMFTALLSGFILGVTYAYIYASQGLSESMEYADEFGKLIAISAASLLVGGGLFYLYPWMTATTLLFGVYLVAFIGAVTFAYNTFGQGIEAAQENAEKFAILIATAGATLLFGGYMFVQNPWMMATTLLFGVYLVAFIGAVTFAYNMFSKGIESAIKDAHKFGILVALSGAILLLGAYVLTNNLNMLWAIPAFGVYLLGFIVGIAFAYRFAATLMQGTMKVAEEFYILVGLSAAILIVGGAFMLIPGMATSALQFAAILTLFVVGLSLAYKIAAKIDVKKAMPTAVALGILVAVSAATILTGGMLFLKNRGLPLAALEFAALTLVFTGAMSLIVWGLSHIKISQLVAGTLALAGICVIAYGFGKAFQEIAKVQQIAPANEILDTLKMMGIVLLAEAAFVGILGGLAMAGGGLGAAVIAAGEVALAGLVYIIDLAAGAFEHVANANNMIAGMKEIDTKKAVKSVESLGSIAWALKALANPLLVPILVAVRTNVSLLSSCLSLIAHGVQDISNLTIPLIDENGQVIGVRHLDETDFDNAAQNVERIITILGSAIIETYKRNKDIFSTGSTIGDLLGMDTPFARVCKSCAVMGEMISTIAKGVKEYADMRIAEYDEHGRIKGYRRLTDADFNAAARNISSIITILGKAIIDTYNSPGAKEMFSWRLIGDNPFQMVVESCSTMGEMISTIAAAVRDYANLRVNIYDNKGTVIGTREMTEDDFKQAGTNVAKILTTLGAAIIATYESNPQMFTDSSMWHTDADKTPFGMVVKAMSGTGELISGGAKAIKDVLDLDIDWSEATKKTLADKIAFCIGVLTDAIYRLAIDENGNPNPAFTDESLWHNSPSDTPVGMVIGSLQGSSALIKDGMNIIQEIMALPDIDEAKVRVRTALAISVLADEIVRLATDPKTKGAFEDDSWWHTSPEKTPVGMVKAALAGASKLVMEGVEVMDKISKLNINDKTIGSIVANIVSAIPNAILKATLFNPNAELKEWWNDDPADDFEDIGDAYKQMSKVLDQIVKTYENANKLTGGEDAANVYLISSYLEHMLQAIPQAIIKANKYAIEESTLDSIISAYEGYEDAIDAILDIYKSTWNIFKKMGASEDEAVIDMVGTGICKMAKYMLMSINAFTATGLDNLEEQVSGFASSMETYQDGITNLANAFNIAPEDTNKYKNMQNAIKGVNLEIANTPRLDQFKEETSLIKSYVSTVNSINTAKIDRLTNLANALTNMSTKLGSLEGLTDVLANKVSVVLSNLTDSLDKSANVINTAEKIQKDRHAKITDALKQLKSLMDKPLNVSVTHKQEKEDTLPDGGMTRDTNSSQPTSITSGGSANGTSSAASNASQHQHIRDASRRTSEQETHQRMPQNRKQHQPIATTTGPSDNHIRSIAREEVRDAINRWSANNDQRGGGARTGAI